MVQRSVFAPQSGHTITCEDIVTKRRYQRKNCALTTLPQYVVKKKYQVRRTAAKRKVLYRGPYNEYSRTK